MNISTYIFGWLFATLLAALFHLWRDGGFWKLVLFMVASWVGFLIGHLMAVSYEFNFMMVGSLHLGGGLIGSVIALFVSHWLGQIETKPKNKG